jgi:hypothetical protein
VHTTTPSYWVGIALTFCSVWSPTTIFLMSVSKGYRQKPLTLTWKLHFFQYRQYYWWDLQLIITMYMLFFIRKKKKQYYKMKIKACELRNLTKNFWKHIFLSYPADNFNESKMFEFIPFFSLFLFFSSISFLL